MSDLFKSFLDVDFYQDYKHGQLVGGDVFLSRKIKTDNRTISVLSDGLGSGIKACVLASLTSTMATKFISSYKDVRHTAEIIMSTLPACKVRKISYATFSIVDINSTGHTSIIEYDNPEVLVVRDGMILNPEKKSIEVKSGSGNNRNLVQFSNFQAQLGDRIILLSDGVTQSGMGTKSWPLGWQYHNACRFILDRINEQPEISARDLARVVVKQAHANDLYKSKDDTTCGVIYLRKPRRLLVVTGPPYDQVKDKDLGDIMRSYQGRKVICGGTTANIISRELNREITVNIKDIDPRIPPSSRMDGIDLVTEGILTLGRVVEILDSGKKPEELPQNAATKLAAYLMDSDIIEFVVGTRINEAHQDPNVPVELEIRRNVVKNIVQLLETRHLKEVKLRFI